MQKRLPIRHHASPGIPSFRSTVFAEYRCLYLVQTRRWPAATCSVPWARTQSFVPLPLPQFDFGGDFLLRLPGRGLRKFRKSMGIGRHKIRCGLAVQGRRTCARRQNQKPDLAQRNQALPDGVVRLHAAVARQRAISHPGPHRIGERSVLLAKFEYHCCNCLSGRRKPRPKTRADQQPQATLVSDPITPLVPISEPVGWQLVTPYGVCVSRSFNWPSVRIATWLSLMSNGLFCHVSNSTATLGVIPPA